MNAREIVKDEVDREVVAVIFEFVGMSRRQTRKPAVLLPDFLVMQLDK